MATCWSGLLRTAGLCAWISTLVPVAHAAGWFDDFNDGNAEDGNPVTWTYNEAGATPGMYTAVSGDYSLSAPGTGTDNDNLIASVNVSFGSTYMRTQTVIVPDELVSPIPEGNPGFVARWNPSTLSGYALYLDHGGQYALLRVDGGAPSVLDILDPFELNSSTDVILELNIVGDQLSAYAWLPGEEKPAAPLLSGIDSTYASGRAGILFNEDDDSSAGVFRWVAAQDTPFVDMLDGDFNNNGTVDAADYVLWRDGLGGPFMPEDYITWRANFGATQGAGGSTSASASVPEPVGLSLVLFAIAGGYLLVRAEGE
jgi:hypothetical protein